MFEAKKIKDEAKMDAVCETAMKQIEERDYTADSVFHPESMPDCAVRVQRISNLYWLFRGVPLPAIFTGKAACWWLCSCLCLREVEKRGRFFGSYNQISFCRKVY